MKIFPIYALSLLLGFSGGVVAHWRTNKPSATDDRPGTRRVDDRQRMPGPNRRMAENGTVARPGVSSRIRMDDIFALRGFEQIERFGEWVAGAGTDDLRAFALKWD